MKIKRILFLLIGMVLVIPGCGTEQKNLTNSSSVEPFNILSDKYNVNEDGYIWNYFDTLNVPYESGSNYEVFTDAARISFYYRVFDNEGSTIDEGYHDWRGSFSFEEKDGILMLNYGFSGSQWQQRYYDVSSGRVSRFFLKPVQTSKELVAYFKWEGDDIVLIIQNMFDPSKYYKEFRRDFSGAVIRDQSTAEFSDNNSKLEITYWINPNDEEVTEIFDLT